MGSRLDGYHVKGNFETTLDPRIQEIDDGVKDSSIGAEMQIAFSELALCVTWNNPVQSQIKGGATSNDSPSRQRRSF